MILFSVIYFDDFLFESIDLVNHNMLTFDFFSFDRNKNG